MDDATWNRVMREIRSYVSSRCDQSFVSESDEIRRILCKYTEQILIHRITEDMTIIARDPRIFTHTYYSEFARYAIYDSFYRETNRLISDVYQFIVFLFQSYSEYTEQNIERDWLLYMSRRVEDSLARHILSNVGDPTPINLIYAVYFGKVKHLLDHSEKERFMKLYRHRIVRSSQVHNYVQNHLSKYIKILFRLLVNLFNELYEPLSTYSTFLSPSVEENSPPRRRSRSRSGSRSPPRRRSRSRSPRRRRLSE